MKTPLCAWCGEGLTDPERRARARRRTKLRGTRDPDETLVIILDHPRDPHRPRYGWHGDCLKGDPIGQASIGKGPIRPSAEAAADIDARGPGRVVRRVRA